MGNKERVARVAESQMMFRDTSMWVIARLFNIHGTIDHDNVIEPRIQETVTKEQTPTPPKPLPLRRSTRERRSALPDDYIVFLQEHEVNIGMMNDDPINFHQAMECFNSKKWINAMNEEIKSMKDNDIRELVQLLEGAKPIGCKWIFKTKKDSEGNVDRYKAHLVAIHNRKALKRFLKDMACKIATIPLWLKDTSLVSNSALRIILRKRDAKDSLFFSSRESYVCQVCTHLDIAYTTGMLGRYLSNPGFDHCKAASYSTYREQKTTCSQIEGQISLRSLGILTPILLDAKIA
ncbi:UNVERIFIED_CONTAM: hypothetical protein Slati_2774000 [Sesamum latifolium]|uniref:Reverse transcriptase Ty1/copia-type domain-containing protein n=1 Tax=Sesamum latifolium TaxID=2727402 RepID=A0AAW2VXW3_9LAMI